MPPAETLLELSHTRAPPREWFSRDIHPVVVDTILKTYRAYRIDPAGLWKYERYLGRYNVRDGNILLWVVAALGESAQVELGKQARRDLAVDLSADSPFSTLQTQGSPLVSANPAAPPEQTAESPLEKGQLSDQQLTHERIANVAGQDHGRFGSSIAAREVLIPARHDPDDPAKNVHLEADRSPNHSGEQNSTSEPFGSAPQPETMRPARLAVGNTGSLTGPHLPSHSSSDIHGLSVKDISKMQASQTRRILAMDIQFGLTDYLDDFIVRTDRCFRRGAAYLDDCEKAELLLTMLTSEVKQRLIGRKALVTPENPEQVYDMLRHEFPPRHGQCLLDLEALTMHEEESAIDFVQKAQMVYVQNQVPLPNVRSSIMSVYMRGTIGFIKHCRYVMLMHSTLDNSPTADDPIIT